MTSILEQQFTEVIIAPSMTDSARERLKTKGNIRVLITGGINTLHIPMQEMRSIDGGLLVQDRDEKWINELDVDVVTTCKPNAQQMKDLLFAWRAVKHVKSNAIVLANSEATIGIGAGQTSRVMSTRIALWQAETAGLSTEGAVMASDAFIPFSDSLELALQHGVTAIIQPGGSMRDDDMIRFANEQGMMMLFTGIRHFRH